MNESTVWAFLLPGSALGVVNNEFFLALHVDHIGDRCISLNHILHIENRTVILAVSNYTTMGEGSGLCGPGIDMIKLLSCWCWWCGGGRGDSGGGHRFNRRYEILLPATFPRNKHIFLPS